MPKRADRELTAQAILKRVRSTLPKREVEQTTDLEEASEPEWEQIDQHINYAAGHSDMGSVAPPMIHHRALVRWVARLVASPIRYLSRFLTVHQTNFNTGVMETLRGIRNRAEELEKTVDGVAIPSTDCVERQQILDQKVRALDERLEGLGPKLEQLTESITDYSIVSTKSIYSQSAAGRSPDSCETLAEATRLLSKLDRLHSDGANRLSDLYPGFEDHFRGTRDEIRARLEPHLQRLAAEIKSLELPVLDLGCGRGEWLELLAKSGFEPIGVEDNPGMVSICKEFGLDVVQEDALDYLSKQPPGSFSCITCFHMFEHLKFERVLQLLDASFSALALNGMLILETPDPENPYVGSCGFYLDPTHNHPLPPSMFGYFVEASGFSNCEVLKLNPWPPPEAGASSSGQKAAGPTLDYAIVARKLSESSALEK